MKAKSIIALFPIILIGISLLFIVPGCKDNDGDSNIIKDADGNVYHLVTIGTQTWLVENLKTTKFRNGDPIPNITDNTDWTIQINSACCTYNNNATNAISYGRMYNWFAVNDSRGICPSGWHVPSDAEWTTLTDYLGGLTLAGGKLKEAGTIHWNTPNTGATNETGFTAYGGGVRYNTAGNFATLGENGNWWSSTEYMSNYGWSRIMYYNKAEIGRFSNSKTNGFSVRCIKD